MWNWSSSVHLIIPACVKFCICKPNSVSWMNLHPDSCHFVVIKPLQDMKEDPMCGCDYSSATMHQKNLSFQLWKVWLSLIHLAGLHEKSMRFPTNQWMLEIHFRTPKRAISEPLVVQKAARYQNDENTIIFRILLSDCL